MGKKIIVVPDSFKGCMTSEAAAGIISRAAKEAGIEAIPIPLADGGEGSIDCILKILGGKIRTVTVTGPDGGKIEARYGVIGAGNAINASGKNSDGIIPVKCSNAGKPDTEKPDQKKAETGTAVIEIAESSGLTRQNGLHPMTANTFGFGELIKDALDNGIRDFLLCLGGSASTDCGLGMAAALGVRFFDREGNCFVPDGEKLGRVERIDISGLESGIRKSSFRIMSDVENPLFGEKGAAYVFGPQKGANPEEVRILDEGLRSVAPKIELVTGCSPDGVAGAGAAGGSGYGCVAFLKAQITGGIDIMLDLCDFDRLVKQCDLVVTGEGRLDEQSLMGKVLSGIRRRAGDRTVVSFCGKCGLKEPLPEDMNIKVIEISRGIPPEESIRDGTKYLKAAAEAFFRDWAGNTGPEKDIKAVDGKYNEAKRNEE